MSGQERLRDVVAGLTEQARLEFLAEGLSPEEADSVGCLSPGFGGASDE